MIFVVFLLQNGNSRNGRRLRRKTAAIALIAASRQQGKSLVKELVWAESHSLDDIASPMRSTFRKEGLSRKCTHILGFVWFTVEQF